jgi:hypothetical protein
MGGMGYAALGMQMLGTVMGSNAAGAASQANKIAYSAQSAVERNAAKVDEWRASDALERGEQSAFSLGLKKAALEGTQRARMAAGGSSLDEGSPLNILQDTQYMHEVDQRTLADNTAREAWTLRTSAATHRSNADLLAYRAGAENPGRAEAATLLTGAGSIAGNWYRMRQPYPGNPGDE